MALIIALILFLPITKVQASLLSSPYEGITGAMGVAAGGMPVSTTRSIFEKVSDFITNQIKEVSGLAWKTTQLYFGTRLARDAAVYLASGGKGQSSFIWNWGEVKKLADGAAGEFLDNLSQDYFGKSACVPGDLNKQVEIDLSARALIADLSDQVSAALPNMCEEICARTAPGSETGKSKAAGVFGETADLFGEGMDSEAVRKDLDKYDQVVNDLINSVLKVEQNMSKSIGQYIFDQVNYTLHGDESTGNKGIADYYDPKADPDHPNNTWLDVFDIDFFYTVLKDKLTNFSVNTGSPEVPVSGTISLDGHGARFTNLLKRILDGAGVDSIEEIDTIFNKKDDSVFYQISADTAKDIMPDWIYNKNSVENILGARYFVYGKEYDGTEVDAQQVSGANNDIKALLDFFSEAYARFDDLQNAPAAAIDLDFLLDMLSTPEPGPLPASSIYQIAEKSLGVFGGLGILENSQREPLKMETDIGLSIFSEKGGKTIFDQAQAVAEKADYIQQTHGANLDELIKASQNFNSCVQICEQGKFEEPQRTCSLSDIKKQEGVMGVTGVSGGISGNLDLGPFGTINRGIQEGTAIGNGKEEHAQEMKQQARLSAKDLKEMSTWGDPQNNPLGQAMDIAFKSQKESAAAKEQALETAKAKDFKSAMGLLDHEIKMPGGQQGKRLDRSFADIRAANNQYTDSILAQMWGVFFNTFYKEFIDNLYDKGLQPKTYGGPFDPTTRQAYGTGVEAAERQFAKFANPNITGGGDMNTAILSRLIDCSDSDDTKRRFDECIISRNFKQAIEQKMTLAQAMDPKVNLIPGSFTFGFTQGSQPNRDQGISYNSMIVLRKYRIIPASWEAAAIWIRDVALKTKKQVTLQEVVDGYENKDSPYFGLVNPYWVLKLPMFQCKRIGAGEEIVSEAPQPFTSYFSEAGDFEVQISRMADYCGDPISCIREKSDASGCESGGWGYCSRERDFWRFPTDRCDAIYKTCQAYADSNNQEVAYLDQTLNLDECSNKAVGCLGYLRDYNWSRAMGEISERIDDLPDTAFTYAPNKFSKDAIDAGVESLDYDTLPIDYKDSKRGWLPDPALYSENIVLNSTGLLDKAPSLWQCTDNNTGESCVYERVAGRAEGCRLPVSGQNCDPWKELHLTACKGSDGNVICYYDPSGQPCGSCSTTEPDAKTVLAASSINQLKKVEDPSRQQRYWCGLPGGAGCFVGQEQVIKLKSGLEYQDNTTGDVKAWEVGHTTLDPGKTCAVGTWKYDSESHTYTFFAVDADPGEEEVPLLCSLYKNGEGGAPGSKRAYLTANADSDNCSQAAVGCQAYWTVEFGSDIYTKVVNVLDNSGTVLGSESIDYYLTLKQKEQFTENLRSEAVRMVKDGEISNADEFKYYDYDNGKETITIAQIIPKDLNTAPDKQKFLDQYKDADYLKDITDLDNIKLEVSNITNLDATITQKLLNYQRQYCTERDIGCRRYTAKSNGSTLAGILNPKQDLCPGQCAGYSMFREPFTALEKRLGTRAGPPGGEQLPTSPPNRYFIANQGQGCPGKYAGCERFIDQGSAIDQQIGEETILRYLTDLRLCVKNNHNNIETYTIIESAAQGATNPVNVRLLKSNYTDPIYYKMEDNKVVLTNNSDDLTLYSSYNGPCINIDPLDNKNKGAVPDKWQCTDTFHDDTINDIKDPLQNCLIIKTNNNGDPIPVSDLTNPDCREYIYFPDSSTCTSDCGAERYPLPYNLPIQAAENCQPFVRSSTTTGTVYNLDPDNPLWAEDGKGLNCKGESALGDDFVSCREYQGRGWQTDGPLRWLQTYGADQKLLYDYFEDVDKWGDWVNNQDQGWILNDSGNRPDRANNVNSEPGQALQFTGGDSYFYNILPNPVDIGNDVLDEKNSKQEFRDKITGQIKSFKLSLWAKLDQDAVLQIGLADETGNLLKNNNGDDAYFKVKGIPGEDYTAADSKWRHIIFNQLFLNQGDNKVPIYLYVKPEGGDAVLDNIVLEDSSSLFLLQNQYDFQGNPSIDSSVPQECNTDYTKDPPAYSKDNPQPYQLYCQAYTTDNNQDIAFKSNGVDLCKDDVVGCQAFINTWNTASPLSRTFWPRGPDEPGLDNKADKYFTPEDAIEYVVAGAEAKCKPQEIGCTMLGLESRDHAGKVSAINEAYLIDDPDQYQDLETPIACKAAEDQCQIYNKKEDGKEAYFKDPGARACARQRSLIGGDKLDWYKPDKKQYNAEELELCDSWYEDLDPGIDKKVPRPKAYCVEKYTNRPVLDPDDKLTAWCDWNEEKNEWDPTLCKGFIDDIVKDPQGVNTGIVQNNVECVTAAAACPAVQSKCTWFRDPLKYGEDRHYFHINPNPGDSKGCGSTVSDDAGCRLFEDTSTEGGPLIYNAKASWDVGSLKGENTGACNAEGKPNCDANRLIRVDRDRTCGEWLSCKSSMQTPNGETVCLDRKPCNVWGTDGECINFVSDAKEGFTNYEIGNPDIPEHKEWFSRLGRLSGYSNVGFDWTRCHGYAVLEDKQDDFCVSHKECVKPENIFIDGACNKQIDDAGTCSDDNKCSRPDTPFDGKPCSVSLDCYSDDELYSDFPASGCQKINQCQPLGSDAVKQGFKSIDHINQIGSLAQVVNGNFEDVVFDVKESAISSLPSPALPSQIKRTYPVGWEYTDCDISRCQMVKRYKDANPSAVRQPDVWRGKYSFMITGKGSVEQVIENIIPEASYVISGWLKVGHGEGYSGIEIEELDADNKNLNEEMGLYNCFYAKHVDNAHCLISQGTDKWEYFSKVLSTGSETRQLRIKLGNNSGSTVIFDDIQIRAHLQVSPSEYIAPTCRLYPVQSALNCDARDNIGNLIRGWRGYCVEPDPRRLDYNDNQTPRYNKQDSRYTNQCVEWWPIDVISGETNVLGAIDDSGFLDAPSPLYYCAETMDKDPGMPLPRLVCLAKNDVSGADAYKYEACKVVALVSDPKPKFYTLAKDDWRIGVDANDFGAGYKVRMILGSDSNGNPDWGQQTGDMVKLHTSGLCVLNGDNFVGDGKAPDCVRGCFLVQGLSGWTEASTNLGVKTFTAKSNQKPAYGKCVWSKGSGSSWTKCAKDLEQYYHKAAYFAFSTLDGTNLNPAGKEHGCYQGHEGDRIYTLLTDYTNKNAYPNEYPQVKSQLDVKEADPWYKAPAVTMVPVGNEAQLKTLAIDLADPLPLKKHCVGGNTGDLCLKDDDCSGGGKCEFVDDAAKNYYTFDNFESVARGRLNTKTWVKRREAVEYGSFEKFAEIVPRVGRSQQCRVITQTIDVAGHNKAWFNKIQTGGPPLPPPLGYNKTDPMCAPFGAAPYLRTPNDIMLQPNNKETGQPYGPKVTVPLELYHPENPENKDKGLICQENYRGQGFYACGGFCNVCVGGSNAGEFCVSDDACGGGGLCGLLPDKLKGVCAIYHDDVGNWEKLVEPEVSCETSTDCPDSVCIGGGDNGKPCSPTCEQVGGFCGLSSCRDPEDLSRSFDIGAAKKAYYQQEPGIAQPPQSGLRRLQNIFAKIFKVWEWVGVEDEDLKKNTGVDTGYYKELTKSELDAMLGNGREWSKDRDIANLAISCSDAGESGFCADFPGCVELADYGCVPQVAGNYANRANRAEDYRDYDYCKTLENQTECSAQDPRCKWRSERSKRCIPYQNQYPDVADIKVNTVEDDTVMLREDNRTVNLQFNISANKNQLPITTILIDWGDDTKTALSGISWDAGARTFTHTYAYYPAGAGGPPSCKNYSTGYECRFRPRIKVVDNWGWCNGQKLFLNGNDLDEHDSILPPNPDLVFKSGDGYAWGYYGADCFTADDARFGMQSWDYFTGHINVFPSTITRDQDNPPEIYLSFYKDQTKLDQAKLDESIKAKLECTDDYAITQCSVYEGQDAPYLGCLMTLNQRAAAECIGNKSCLIEQDCQFNTAAGDWKYTLTVADDSKTGNVKNFNHSFKVTAGIKPKIGLFIMDPTLKSIDDYKQLTKDQKYEFWLLCQRNSDADPLLQSCQLSQNAGSSIFLNNCLDSAVWDVGCNNVAECSGQLTNCILPASGTWSFDLNIQDVEGNSDFVPYNINVKPQSSAPTVVLKIGEGLDVSPVNSIFNGQKLNKDAWYSLQLSCDSGSVGEGIYECSLTGNAADVGAECNEDIGAWYLQCLQNTKECVSDVINCQFNQAGAWNPHTQVEDSDGSIRFNDYSVEVVNPT
jgi:hypothetical protein